MEFSKRLKRKNVVYLMVFALSVTCLCAVLAFLMRKPLLVAYYRLHPYDTASAFWDALRENDEYMAKQVTDSVQWPRIDQWMVDHKVTQCDWSDEALGPTGIYPLEGDTRKISINFVCTAEDGRLYCFAIDDILVKRTGKGWLVTDWGEVHEDCAF